MKIKSENMLTDLDLQMSIYTAIADRNPRIIALYKGRSPGEILADGNPGITSEEYNNICREIYGSTFPSAFPVLDLPDRKKQNEPWYLYLQVDLRFNKDEIMYRLKKWIDKEWELNHQQTRRTLQRKHVQKWVDYLQIWDLRRGIQPDANYSKLLRVIFKDEDREGRRWTFPQIAKFLYPDTAGSPEKLLNKIDKVKKQYRAAYKLIFGEKYNHKKSTQRLKEFQEGGLLTTRTCENCSERDACSELCPNIIEQLELIEIKQKHLLVNHMSLPNIEYLKKTSKKPIDE